MWSVHDVTYGWVTWSNGKWRCECDVSGSGVFPSGSDYKEHGVSSKNENRNTNYTRMLCTITSLLTETRFIIHPISFVVWLYKIRHLGSVLTFIEYMSSWAHETKNVDWEFRQTGGRNSRPTSSEVLGGETYSVRRTRRRHPLPKHGKK